MWCFAGKKSLRESCRMGWCIVVTKLICSLGHCECNGHTVHKLSQRRLTAVWLAPQESDCSRMGSKVSSDWLPSYIKAARPVLEIFKMDRYFLGSLHVYCVIEEPQVKISWLKLFALQFQVSGIWHCLAGWVGLDISKNHSSFIVKFQAWPWSRRHCESSKYWEPLIQWHVTT
jgi:hypothetical protein